MEPVASTPVFRSHNTSFPLTTSNLSQRPPAQSRAHTQTLHALFILCNKCVSTALWNLGLMLSNKRDSGVDDGQVLFPPTAFCIHISWVNSCFTTATHASCLPVRGGPPSGSSILIYPLFFVREEAHSRGGTRCCKRQKVSRGVTEHTAGIFGCLAAKGCSFIRSLPITFSSLFINNADFILPSQQTLKSKKSALQILTISKVTSRRMVN